MRTILLNGAVDGRLRAEEGGATEPTGGAASAPADTGAAEAQAADAPTSAFAAGGTAADDAADKPAETPASGDAPTADAPTSAFAAKKVAADGTAADKTHTAEGAADDLTREQVAAMSDADWVKQCVEGADETATADTPILEGLAKTAREIGVTPKQMQALDRRLGEVLNERIGKLQAEKDAADREAAQKATQECLAAFDDSEWADIRAAGKEFIPEDSELGKMMQGSLGSNKEMLTILKALGESLRGDASPSTGASGSGLSLEERMFRKTVPSVLR
jgi:hypothetical protein